MGSKLTDKKRKAQESDSESDDELGNGLFDGVLSQSEDEEDYIPSDDDADESGTEGTEGSEDEEEDDGILSDDIPSDLDEDEMSKLVKQQEELEITEPGVDPKRKDDDSEERNFRIETDANGGERYVYEWVAFLAHHVGLDADEPFSARLTPSTTRTTQTPRGRSIR